MTTSQSIGPAVPGTPETGKNDAAREEVQRFGGGEERARPALGFSFSQMPRNFSSRSRATKYSLFWSSRNRAPSSNPLRSAEFKYSRARRTRSAWSWLSAAALRAMKHAAKYVSSD